MDREEVPMALVQPAVLVQQQQQHPSLAQQETMKIHLLDRHPTAPKS